MDRRDFLKVGFGAGIGLFLPRWIRPAWKQKPSVLVATPWDYEVALLDSAGMEIAGNGYARARGMMRTDFSLEELFGIVNNKKIAFPPAREDWGEVSSMQIIDKNGMIIFPGIFNVNHKNGENLNVTKNCTLQFDAQNIQITMT